MLSSIKEKLTYRLYGEEENLMKKKYEVKITEISELIVRVEAENEAEAEAIVEANWSNCEYVLNADNFIDVTFEVIKS